jgi:hypothetical protein
MNVPVVAPQHRATLSKLADVLIPAGEGEHLPSASQAGVAERWLDEVLSALPEVGAPLIVLLETLGGREPSAAVVRLETEDPVGYDLLCTVVAGAYFLNPDIRQKIGYPGQQALPIQVEDPPDYEQDGLLASVIARGPIYRPTPAG